MMELTKQQFLDRCANAYDMGYATEKRLSLMDKWLDFVLRLEGGQMRYAVEFLDAETHRLPMTSNNAIGNLAGDVDGYALNCLAAILTHPCQICACDPNAWHTRSAFCPHRERREASQPSSSAG